MTRARWRAQAGFTLVELLTVVSILGVISYALTESVIQALRTTDGTARRYGESLDAQFFAASFTTDVQSADKVEAPVAGGDCTDGPSLLRLSWTDGRVGKIATYAVVAGGAGQRHLVRRYCERDLGGPGDDDDGTVEAVRRHAVSEHVGPDDPVVACQPSPCGEGTRTVTMGVASSGGYGYTLTGTRRSR